MEAAESESNVTVCVASYNTKAATELCIRSMRRRADVPFRLVVGDGGSSDGSLEMLERFERAGVLVLDPPEGRKKHAEWLDHWYATCPTRFLVFSDSDVDYRGKGWLVDMLAMARETGAALVAGRVQPDWTQRPRFMDGSARVLPGARPEPCLLLLDLQQLRGTVGDSFAYHEEPFPGDPERKLAFDVGGAFLRSAEAVGLRCEQMPLAFQRKYRHWGGFTRRRGPVRNLEPRTRLKQVAKVTSLRLRLLCERMLDLRPSTRRRAPIPNTIPGGHGEGPSSPR